MEFTRLDSLPGWERAIDYDIEAHRYKDPRSLFPNRTEGVYYVHAAPSDLPYDLYRVTTSTPVSIAEICGVGSIAMVSVGRDLTDKVLEELGKLHRRYPLDPFFADIAGFKCGFIGELDADFPGFIDQTITEGLEAYYSDGDVPIGNRVKADGFLDLWWD